jgi:Endonuclease/Exonuclease/phosphatase family
MLAQLGWNYVALIALWLVLRAIFFDQIWWLALLNTFAIYLFIPLPLLLLAGLWRRHWTLVFGLAIPTTALRSFLSDSFREAGWGLRNTNYASDIPFPMQRIDYVWHNAGLNAIAAEVGQAGGSDHLPVVVRLRLFQKQ